MSTAADIAIPSPPGQHPAHNLKFNRQLLGRLFQLCHPYWTRPGAWRSWLVLALILGIVWSNTAFGVWLSHISRDLNNALVDKKVDAYWALFYQQVFVGLALALCFWPMEWLSGRLQLHWRSWMTRQILDQYLGNRAYYDINNSAFVDNPDQRIQSEVEPFCEAIIGFPTRLLFSFAQMGAQAVILLGVSMTLFYFTIGLSIVQVYVTYRLAQPTIKQNFDVIKTEADFRFGLVYLREHTENVAFYAGEQRENRDLSSRLATVVKRIIIKLNYALKVRLAELGFAFGWQHVPYIVLVPLFFASTLDFGAIGQAQAAAMQINSSFVLFAGFIPVLAGLAPHVVRLAELVESCQAAPLRDEGAERIRVSHHASPELVVESLRLSTPLGENNLVQDLSLRVPEGARLLIVGQSGVGKSSLLRAFAGLWTRGSGHITMPELGSAMFLPQKSYMPLGSLRDQILYPRAPRQFSDDELQAILERVDLGDLAQRYGGFDSVREWSKALSLGEQQRLAIARVLVQAPKLIVLDEATSALDPANEARVYGLLTRSNATVISVGHRESLTEYHTASLRLLPGGAWEIGTSGGAPQAIV